MTQLTKTKTIFTMEAQRFFGNRRFMISTLIFSPIVVFVLLFAISSMANRNSVSCIEVYGAKAFESQLSETVKMDENIIFKENATDYEERVRSGKNIVVVVAFSEAVQVYYDSSLLVNTSVLNTAQSIANNILALQINEEKYSEFVRTVETIKLEDISSSSDYIEFALIPVLGLIFVIALVLINSSIADLAVDAFAGEKERGTFDMLRLSGSKVSAIVAGKFGFVALVGVAVLVLEGVFLVLGLQQYQPELYKFAIQKATENPLWFVPVLICIFSVSILCTALFVAIGASFEKVKQAFAYTGIVQIVLSLFSYAPSVWNENILNYLPIGNLSIVTQAALEGESTTAYVVVSLSISLVIAIAALIYTASVLERERKK